MANLFKKLVDRIDAAADRPADPTALTSGRTSRRGSRATLPEPAADSGEAAPNVELSPERPRRTRRPARPELEGQEAIDRILAEQRNRMRGHKREQPGGPNGG